MSGKKVRMGSMAIKIDSEKAYERLKRSFIMSCVTSLSVEVLLNGGAQEEFKPSWGIRQEDPVSPYNFILCMEVLGFIIKDKCDSKLWNPVLC